jgi:hypothetical protein
MDAQHRPERRPEPEDIPEEELPVEVREVRALLAEVQALMDQLARQQPAKS